MVVKRGKMKKVVLIGLLAVLCASCISKSDEEIQSINLKKQAIARRAQKRAEQQNNVQPVQVYEQQQPVVSVPVENFNSYRQDIVVKTMGNDYIVYEYSDVRIDQVAPLASRYCYETNPGKKAYLRDIYMHKNHKRRATFDCVDLARE